MRQIWIPKTGEPEVLEVREAPDPEPLAGEVRVRVRASGINFADVLARMGLYPDSPPLPAVVGYEVAGVVDGVGEGVEGFSDGDRVLVFTRFGGYSDVVCAPAGLVAPIPDALDFGGAASIPVNWLTAWLMLVRLGNVRAGDKVLVHACAGGVGTAAVQICRARRRRGHRHGVGFQARTAPRDGSRALHRLPQPGLRGRGQEAHRGQGCRHRPRCGGW